MDPSNTRPDISYAISCVSRYMDQLQKKHMTVTKSILCYLKGMQDCGLFYPALGVENLISFSDVDYGHEVDTRRSTSGILHKLGESAINWSSKR